MYEPFIDRVFNFAKKYGMKILLDMHGLPGSQNGENHSGCITGTDNYRLQWNKTVHFFDNDFNKDLAVRSLGLMAKKCQENIDNCYGVQLINED